MAITQGFTTSFKRDLFKGYHDFTADVMKLALYTSSATLSTATTAYSATNEVSGTGYSAGGATVTCNGVTISGETIYIDFQDVAWVGATFTARGALLYSTQTNGGSGTTDAIMVLNFGVDKTVSGSTFTVQWPAADATNAIIRIV